MARTPRKWQGARNPSGLKRVRQSERRHAILQPRRSAAKTLVAKAVSVATAQPEGVDIAATLSEAVSALDRAAKSGAIHPNAAARRKSRLAKKVNAALGGAAVVTTGHVAKSTGKAAALKAAKARIAAGKAVKAKGAQTAAGKARAALSKTTRVRGRPGRGAGRGGAGGEGHAGDAAKAAAEGDGQGTPPKATAAKAATAKATAAKTATAKADRRRRPRPRPRPRRRPPRRPRQSREGRAEDDQGQEGRVVLGRRDHRTPRSSTGAS